ncbi:hypothetical protein SHIRM173S_11765 [Streptomyces hirsutus]
MYGVPAIPSLSRSHFSGWSAGSIPASLKDVTSPSLRAVWMNGTSACRMTSAVSAADFFSVAYRAERSGLVALEPDGDSPVFLLEPLGQCFARGGGEGTVEDDLALLRGCGHQGLAGGGDLAGLHPGPAFSAGGKHSQGGEDGHGEHTGPVRAVLHVSIPLVARLFHSRCRSFGAAPCSGVLVAEDRAGTIARGASGGSGGRWPPSVPRLSACGKDGAGRRTCAGRDGPGRPALTRTGGAVPAGLVPYGATAPPGGSLAVAVSVPAD